MIKISIIIPIYNAEQYLEQCLESVINQSLKEIEIICVNDGSIDNSLRILEKYSRKDNRIIIINQENEGSSKARNKALEVARGEYCLNIDSDDWIEQGYFETMYEKAKKENLDMLVSDIVLVSSNGREILKDIQMSDEKLINGNQWVELFLKHEAMGYTWNKLIKRKSIGTLNYNENIFCWEDVNFLMKLALNCNKIGKLNKSFYNYRQGENNGSRKKNIKSFLDKEKCYLELESIYRLNYKNEKILDLLYYKCERELLIELLNIKCSITDKEKYLEKRNEYLARVNFFKMKEIEKKYSYKWNNKKLILFLRLCKFLPKNTYFLAFEIVKKLKIPKLN